VSYGRYHVAAGGKPNHADLVRIDPPLGRMKADEAHRPLRIL
jgi:hypothetical protein